MRALYLAKGSEVNQCTKGSFTCANGDLFALTVAAIDRSSSHSATSLPLALSCGVANTWLARALVSRILFKLSTLWQWKIVLSIPFAYSQWYVGGLACLVINRRNTKRTTGPVASVIISSGKLEQQAWCTYLHSWRL